MAKDIIQEEIEPKANPLSFIVVVLIAAAFCIGMFMGSSGKSDVVGIDLSAVAERDSIIAVYEDSVGVLTQQVLERDTIISILVGHEEEQRDSIFVHLEDKFEGVPEPQKEALIEEALNAIQ